MHTRHIAAIEIILGALIIGAAFMCTWPYSAAVLGGMVLGFGIPLLVHPILPK